MHELAFTISGMHCESCIKFCTLKLRKLPGFTGVNIDLASGRAILTSDTEITLAAVQGALAGHYEVVAALPAAA